MELYNSAVCDYAGNNERDVLARLCLQLISLADVVAWSLDFIRS